MQFKVPQNVQREDKIVGPLTLKQLIICGIGFAVAYAIYTSLAKDFIWVTWILPVSLVGLITVAFAFFRPVNMSFTKFLFSWIEFTVLPRQRFWIQGSGDAWPPTFPASTKGQSKVEKKAEAKAQEVVDKHKKLEELSKILNSPQK